ncbi:MAG: glycoside hydrolase family 88 protein [Clostridia bacterium]|nr:glycoside hydrolase family 88 protein [Clostridia bacterium]
MKKRAMSFVLVCALMASMIPAVTITAADSIDEGLIAYYNFDSDDSEPSEIIDQSGNGNNAAVLNTEDTVTQQWGPQQSTTTISNKLTVSDGVAVFPGNSYTYGMGGGTAYLGAALQLPSDFNQGVTDFTFSAWINADSSYIYDGNLTRIFDFGNISNNNAYNSIFVRHNSAAGILRLQDRGIASSADDASSYTQDTLSDLPFTDAWGLLTVTFEYDENSGYYSAKVYINGELNETLSSDTTFTRSLDDLGEMDDSSNGLFIGRTVWGATNQNIETNPDFCGQMDEIRIYNRAITASEVETLYKTTSPMGELTMTSYSVSSVTTTVGEYPSLPSTVTVTYNTGEVKEESVTWETLDLDDYSETGTIYVSGVTSNGNTVQVKVVVMSDGGVLDAGLVLYYTFDTEEEYPEQIADMSGNGNDATVSNNTDYYSGWGSELQLDQKLQVTDGVAVFPGSAQEYFWNRTRYYDGAAIQLPDNVNENIEDFTYSAWIYVDTSYVYNSNMQRFFDFGVDGSDAYDSIFYRYTASSGDSRLQDRGIASSADDATSYVSATLSDTPFNDTWAMLTVTYEKGSDGYYTPTIYINGVERTEYDASATQLTRSLGDLGDLSGDSNGLWIGRTLWKNETNPDFCGKMDEIRLYNRALLASEVAELYETYKPSDYETDYETITVSVEEDVTVSGRWPTATNLYYLTDIMASAPDGVYDDYQRFVLMRADLSASQLSSAANSTKSVLRIYCNTVTGEGDYYLYALTGDNSNWELTSVTYENFTDQTNAAVDESGVVTGGELVSTLSLDSSASGSYVEWDITDFMNNNTEESFSFVITSSSGGANMASYDSGDGPEIVIYSQGAPITVNRVTEDGDTISTTTAYATAGSSYTYNVTDRLKAYNGELYVIDEEASTLTIASVTEEGGELTVVYKKASSVTVNDISVLTYVGKAPSLPSVVTVTADGESASFAAAWDDVDAESYAETGEFTVSGSVASIGLDLTAYVQVFPEYNGAVGGDLTIYIYYDGELYTSYAVSRAYGSTFTLDESYNENSLYDLVAITGDASAIGDEVVMNELGQHIELYYEMKEMIEADLTAEVRADDFEETSYSLSIEANVLNTELEDKTVVLAVATYNSDGILTACETETASVASRTGETVTIAKKMEYTDDNKNSVIYLWSEDLEPLADAINVAELKVNSYLDEEVLAMMPTYDDAVSYVKAANDYWQSTYSYNTWTEGIDPAFWSRAAYHTGNMAAYELVGDEDYLQYSVDWANDNNWMGNEYGGDPSTWTWGYSQSQGSTAVLFGDWQTCFQTYIDLYNLGVEDADLTRVYEVMDYQISTDEDSYWWWTDALYMVMPVLSKLYKLTDNEDYLDAMYKYFMYAKELMYDGPNGIPTSADGYTTSAALKSGASYSDPDDYKYLFFRDASYVYPLNPNSGHEDEKNFWARGNGWAFAALAKVMTDMPETYEHYDEFYTTYMEMAAAIIACQEVDDEGHGFWTQSMLQNYPTGSNGNDEGYETSGTAFFTYGLFWGINNGLLDEATYLEPAIRAYGYLNEVALLDNGAVGYIQAIGSNATQATAQNSTHDFGVGAFLLADCEAAKWAQNNEN